MWHENICDFSWWQSWALQILWFAVSIHKGRKWYISVRGEWRERYNLFSLPDLPTPTPLHEDPLSLLELEVSQEGLRPQDLSAQRGAAEECTLLSYNGGGGECSEKQAPAVGKPEIFTGPAPSSLQPWWVTKRPFSGRPNINSSGLSWEQDVCLLLKLQTWQSAQAYNCN